MERVLSALSFIQHNKFLYVFIVALFSALIATIGNFMQKRIDASGKAAEPRVRRHITKTVLIFLITFIITLTPLVISHFFPYTEASISVLNPDGYLKLSFLDGRFAYYDFIGQEYYDENDIVSPTDRAFLGGTISPLIYITILDEEDHVIYDGNSEHTESCLIGLKYGSYELIASSYGYQKYTVSLEVIPENKEENIWPHEIHLIPDVHVARDLHIQASAPDGTLYKNMDASIGFPGYSLSSYLFDDGCFEEMFTLANGEYLVVIDDLNMSGRFVVNDLTQDGDTILVKLSPIN